MPESGELIISGVRSFSLSRIEKSGQAFRWSPSREDGNDALHSAFDIPAFGEIAHVEQDGDRVIISGVEDAERFVHYLALDEDYDALIARMHALGNEDMDRMLDFGEGIRVLHQEPFEAAVTSIITQNNNIPRITRCVERMCGGDRTPFPNAAELGCLLEEDDCGLGYRRDYLQRFCAVADEWLAWVAEGGHTLDEDMAWLLGCRGIGEKVASCICLFGLEHADACPMDVWMKRAEQRYGIPMVPGIEGIQQQFIFYWMTNGPTDDR